MRVTKLKEIQLLSWKREVGNSIFHMTSGPQKRGSFKLKKKKQLRNKKKPEETGGSNAHLTPQDWDRTVWDILRAKKQ